MTSMNKRKLHHIWFWVRRVKPWYFVALAVVCALVCLFAMRANNQHMAVLRNNVYVADKNNGNVQGALDTLQAYVIAHMNTSLTSGNTGVYPPIQLEYTYERLQQANGGGQNSGLYTQAQAFCQAQDSTDFSGHNRVPCIEQYVENHGVKLANISPSLYQFAFLSPTWSPDLAGWSMVATVLFLLLALAAFATRRWFRGSM